jgi:hypothetical protein
MAILVSRSQVAVFRRPCLRRVGTLGGFEAVGARLLLLRLTKVRSLSIPRRLKGSDEPPR